MTEAAAGRPPRTLLARAYLALVLARPLARLSPRRLRHVLLRPRLRPVRLGPSAETIVQAVDHVLGSGWPLVRRGCLPRGIALYELLASRGEPAALSFGVDRGLPSEGHCWLERDGEPLYERVDPRERFVRVWQVPSSRA